MIGLTGGLASGKSTAANLFRQLGAEVICCDRLAHEALKKGTSAYQQIKRVYGPTVLKPNGQVDRKKLAKAVFGSRKKVQQLEKWVHPYVWAQVNRHSRHSKKKIVVVDVPLLFETRSEKKFDQIVVVAASQKKQLERLEKKGWSKKEATQRMRHQMPLAKKIKKADIVLRNTTRQALRRQVKHYFKQLQSVIA